MAASQRRLLPCRTVSRFYQQAPQQRIALLADMSQTLLVARTVFCRDQSQIAAQLLARLEAGGLSQGKHERQRPNRTHSHLVPHPPPFPPLPPLLFPSPLHPHAPPPQTPP